MYGAKSSSESKVHLLMMIRISRIRIKDKDQRISTLITCSTETLKSVLVLV